MSTDRSELLLTTEGGESVLIPPDVGDDLKAACEATPRDLASAHDLSRVSIQGWLTILDAYEKPDGVEADNVDRVVTIKEYLAKRLMHEVAMRLKDWNIDNPYDTIDEAFLNWLYYTVPGLLNSICKDGIDYEQADENVLLEKVIAMTVADQTGAVFRSFCESFVGSLQRVRAEHYEEVSGLDSKFSEFLSASEARRRLAKLLTTYMPDSNNRRAKEAGVAVLYIDIDRFKRINDDRSYADGNMVIRGIGTEISGVLRDEKDLMARDGGEEVVVVLNGVSRRVALERAELIRQRIESRMFTDHSSEQFGVTVSIGVVHTDNLGEMVTEPCDSQLDDTVAAFIDAASKAEQLAKRTGRNMVVAHWDMSQSSGIDVSQIDADTKAELISRIEARVAGLESDRAQFSELFGADSSQVQSIDNALKPIELILRELRG